MAGKVLSEEAGRALAAQVKARYGTEVAVSGLQIQLKNGVKDSSGAKVVLSTATIPVATQSVAGAMSAGDKAKLDGIAAGAKPYGKAGKNVLGLVMTTSGAEDTAVKASGSGYAPTPIVDGVPYFHDTTYVAATQSAPGLMAAADKKKLDGVESGANKTVVDAALSGSSANPVQNKAVKAALDAKADDGVVVKAVLDADGNARTPVDGNVTIGFAQSDAAGLVKADSSATTGNGVRIDSNGALYIDRQSVTSALGYTPPTSDTKPSAMKGATADAAGAAGYVPAPAAGKNGAYLRGDGTWCAVDSAPTDSSSSLVSSGAVKAALNAKAPTASPTLTGTPKAPTAAAGTNTTQIATTAFVQAAVSAAQASAAMYQGAANSYADITKTAYRAGWYWVVKTAGSYAGQACEIGDMVFANKKKGSETSDADFDVIQSNIDYVPASDVKAWFD